jgi:hypothetical protein
VRIAQELRLRPCIFRWRRGLRRATSLTAEKVNRHFKSLAGQIFLATAVAGALVSAHPLHMAI